MITEDYVSFETAKLLKEKGFKGQGEHFYEDNKITNYINYWSRITPKQRYEAIEAPTLQMAMKWLRTKNIFIDIFHYNSKMAPFVWMIFAYNVLTPQRAETYEEAEEAAIKYALENWDDVNKVLNEYYKYDNLLPKI